jgi:hypothetical protein
MARRRRSPQAPLATEQVSLVRGGTRARHGGSCTSRLLSPTGMLRLKKKLNPDGYGSGNATSKAAARQIPAEPPRQRATTPYRAPNAASLHFDAIKALVHVEKYGDTSAVTRLIDKMGRQSGVASLLKWFTKFGSFSRKDGRLKFRVNHRLTDADLVIAENTPVLRGRYA